MVVWHSGMLSDAFTIGKHRRRTFVGVSLFWSMDPFQEMQAGRVPHTWFQCWKSCFQDRSLDKINVSADILHLTIGLMKKFPRLARTQDVQCNGWRADTAPRFSFVSPLLQKNDPMDRKHNTSVTALSEAGGVCVCVCVQLAVCSVGDAIG